LLVGQPHPSGKINNTGWRKQMDELKDWQNRVVHEKKELCERIAKLRQFGATAEYAGLDEIDRDNLIKQERFMQSYSDVLGKRIERFK
jgi:hypothetical protein